MKLISYDGSVYNLNLTSEELILTIGAINEVCNGIHIDDWDFETRLGVSKADARVFLKELDQLLSCKSGDHEDSID